MTTPAVLPWELPGEWRRRTRYGRAKLLLLLPGLAFAWAVAAVLAVAAVAVLAVFWLIGKAVLWVFRSWPSTYRAPEAGGEGPA